jgi:ribosomal protein S18 acetylase RimI-like enzyme
VDGLKSALEIQRLVPHDAAQYRSVMLHGYLHHGDAFTSQHAEREPLPLSWWQNRIHTGSDAPEQVFGAFDEFGELRGVGGVMFESRPKIRHRSTLFGMCVLPQARGQGAGFAIVNACIAAARAHPGTVQIDLDVTSTNQTAVRLYERCGFQSYGCKPNAIQHEGRAYDKLLMWRVV